MFLLAVARIRAPHEKRSTEPGSGAAVLVEPVVELTSSMTNEPPLGSPVMVMLEMPPVKLTERSSFGLLPGSPERASLLENGEVAEATLAAAALKAWMVMASA